MPIIVLTRTSQCQVTFDTRVRDHWRHLRGHIDVKAGPNMDGETAKRHNGRPDGKSVHQWIHVGVVKALDSRLKGPAICLSNSQYTSKYLS